MRNILNLNCAILVANDGAIWVFAYERFRFNQNDTAYIFSDAGKFLSFNKIDFGDFKLNVGAKFAFRNDYWYGLLESKNRDDVTLKIVKFRMNPYRRILK